VLPAPDHPKLLARVAAGLHGEAATSNKLNLLDPSEGFAGLHVLTPFEKGESDSKSSSKTNQTVLNPFLDLDDDDDEATADPFLEDQSE